MMRKSAQNSQMRVLAMAMGGATVAAVSMMFVPVSMLEGIAGSTGLSELIPAARAPLGDTARALIAFGAGAFTLAVLAFALLRQDSAPAIRTEHSVPAADWAADEDAPSFKERLSRIRIPAIHLPKMPWQKDADDITELADLPKLRNGDVHPDAPPRRPLVASQDLPVLDLAEVATPVVEHFIARPPVVEAEPLAEAEHAEPEAPPAAVATPSATPPETELTLAEMVAQLEAAVAVREKQLAELEMVAAELVAESSRNALQADDIKPEVTEQICDDDVTINPPRAARPPLEVVPASPVKDDDMDSALAAALATLQRMSGTGR
jgi:hypothetical protein